MKRDPSRPRTDQGPCMCKARESLAPTQSVKGNRAAPSWGSVPMPGAGLVAAGKPTTRDGGLVAVRGVRSKEEWRCS